MTWHRAIPTALRRMAWRGVRAVGWACLAAVIAGLVVRAALAVCLADLSGGRPRYGWAAVVVLATVAGVVVVRRRRIKWVVPFSRLPRCSPGSFCCSRRPTVTGVPTWFLDVSIETRLEKGEPQSGLQSLFRQYELIYVFADERDVVRVRTNRRDQDVYLYPTRLTPGQARAVLLSFLARAYSLAARPEWYNTLTTNCTTSILPHARAAGAPGRWSLDVLLSGRAPRQAYANGLLDTRVPFDELEARSLINPLAKGADSDPAFSRRIRAALTSP